MLLKGKITATSNWDLVSEVLSSPNTKGMILDVFDEDRYRPLLSQGMLYGSFLMPPYEAMAAGIDGNVSAYHGIYTQYLSSPEVISNITKMMRILFLGYNIVIFIPSNIIEFGHHNIVLEHFMSTYGIVIECKTQQYNYMEEADNMNKDLMFMFDALTLDEYIENESFMRTIPEQILTKLFSVLNLNTVKEQIRFVERMRNRNPITQGHNCDCGGHNDPNHVCGCNHNHNTNQQIVPAFSGVK